MQLAGFQLSGMSHFVEAVMHAGFLPNFRHAVRHTKACRK